MKSQIETIGYLLKQENVFNIDKGSFVPGTFILETRDQFPGYHSQLPGTNALKPGHLFLVTKQKYPGEHIMRATGRIKRIMPSAFVPAQTLITIDHEQFPSIRIKDLEDYNLILELQNLYLEQGIEFYKRKRKIDTMALLQIKKYFLLEPLNEFVYKDLELPDIHYIALGRLLKWKYFEKLTQIIKVNHRELNFDGALAGIFRRLGVVDAVRVFGEGMDLDRLMHLRALYLEFMQKIDAGLDED